MRTFKPTSKKDNIDPDSPRKDLDRGNKTRTKLSPKELAAQWGKDYGSILALIRQGELTAIDVAISRGRPRFLIDPADIALFEERRRVYRPEERTPRQRKRRKMEPQGAKYF